jgi:hypothetical protein
MKYHKLLLSELKEYYFKLVKQREFLNEIEVQTLRIKLPSKSKPFPTKRFHEV